MLTLREIFLKYLDDEKQALDRLADSIDSIQDKGDHEMLWHLNFIQGLGYFFIEKDIASSKDCFYRCGRIDEFLIKKYDSRLLDSGMANLTCVLLSDNKELIIRYADLGHSKYQWMVENGHTTLMYALQQSILGNWDKVRWSLDIMATKNEKLNKVLLPDRLFLEALLLRDERKIGDALQLLLKDHKKRNKHMGIAQQYISIPTLAYAKLAWVKGIEVSIEHPLIPPELLPCKPLQKYDDKYHFLDDV